MVSPTTAVSTWNIDQAHSSIEFAVKHMMFATVKGRFARFEGVLELNDAAPRGSRVDVTIDTSSIDTGTPDRDAHLRSEDFFAADRFAGITFRSTAFEPVDGDSWRVTGDLTIRDVTRPVTLDVEYEGEIVDAWGKTRRAFSAETSINRKDFGLNWNMLVETGGVVVGDKVRIQLNISAVREDQA